MNYILTTQLTVEECLLALKANAEEDSFPTNFTLTCGMSYRIKGNNFRLRKRRYYRNSFAPNFYGQVIKAPNCTIVFLDYRLSRWEKFFSLFWCSSAVVVGGALFLSSVHRAIEDHNFRGNDILISVALTFLYPVFMWYMIKISEYLDKGEKQQILDFVRRTLQAKDLPVTA